MLKIILPMVGYSLLENLLDFLVIYNNKKNTVRNRKRRPVDEGGFATWKLYSYMLLALSYARDILVVNSIIKQETTMVYSPDMQEIFYWLSIIFTIGSMLCRFYSLSVNPLYEFFYPCYSLNPDPIWKRDLSDPMYLGSLLLFIGAFLNYPSFNSAILIPLYVVLTYFLFYCEKNTAKVCDNIFSRESKRKSNV